MKKFQVILCTGILLTAAIGVFPSYGESASGNTGYTGQWIYKMESSLNKECGSEAEQDGFWYHLSDGGLLDTGWSFFDGHWYYFSAEEGIQKGRMMTGWQWIDGRCYFLTEKPVLQHPQGAMYAGERTPDGYLVGEHGAWLDENGAEWYLPGKGQLSVGEKVNVKVKGTAVKAHGESGGGGGHGGGGGKRGNNGKPVKGEEVREDLVPDSDGESENMPDFEDENIQPPDLDGENIQPPNLDGENIQPPDLEGEKDPPPESENMAESNPTDKEVQGDGEILPATPSEAKMVSWEIRFIEEEDQNRKILREQRGKTEEGTELVVDFPEMIEGEDGWRYQALEKSPKRITVSGSGLQKYVVLFRKTEQMEEEPEQKEEQKLNAWIQTAQTADLEITGREDGAGPIITDNQEESRERLLNLISMVHDGARHEIYLVARNHSPSAVVIGQAFTNTAGVSALLMDEFRSSGDRFCIVRIGFHRIWEIEDCVHELETLELVPGECVSDGHERFRCSRCGYEETVRYPAVGHSDPDGDGICNICYQAIDESTDSAGGFFHEGDIQVRNIGGKPYRFRCIDEDYSDNMNNKGDTALFLCETVIRSDIESDEQSKRKMNFGSDNNYKTSVIRNWLQENADINSRDISSIYTGVNTAYQGTTEKGQYEQFSFDDLKEYEKPFQKSEDQFFIFSLEEAVKYRDLLWKFNGSSQNNPQTQNSPYSKGYYLRTPQYKGQEDFQYGTGIYAVDIVNGSLHPVTVFNTDMGIRPAFVISQHSVNKQGET